MHSHSHLGAVGKTENNPYDHISSFSWWKNRSKIFSQCPKGLWTVMLARLTSSMQRELPSLEYSVSHSTQTAPYIHACQNRLLFAKRPRGTIRLRVGFANTPWTSGIVSPNPKDLARINGTPQPNQKWLPAQGIESGYLNHESQPLTIGPFLATIAIIMNTHFVND